MFNAAKSRAKQRELEFSITEDDILIPEICPILGVKLERGVKQAHDNAPSVDRVDTTKGYTSNNIRVISLRANRYKSDMTKDIIRKLWEYVSTS